MGAKEDASLGAVRSVMSLYRSACHYADPPDNGIEDGARLRIASDAAFQRILIFTLSEADTFFRRLLTIDASPGTPIPAATVKSAKCVLSFSVDAVHPMPLFNSDPVVPVYPKHLLASGCSRSDWLHYVGGGKLVLLSSHTWGTHCTCLHILPRRILPCSSFGGCALVLHSLLTLKFYARRF